MPRKILKSSLPALAALMALFLAGCETPSQTLTGNTRSSGWSVSLPGWERFPGKRGTTDYVPQGQSPAPGQYEEIVTDTFLDRKAADAQEFYEVYQQLYRSRFGTIQFNRISGNTRDLTFEWWHNDSGAQYGPEHQLTRVVYRPEGFYLLSYARPGSRMPSSTRGKWLSFLRNATLR